jgi:hypothetical protein
MMGYFPCLLALLIQDLTDDEFDQRGWAIDPDLDLDARDTRDEELLLDLTGNLDSPCA